MKRSTLTLISVVSIGLIILCQLFFGLIHNIGISYEGSLLITLVSLVSLIERLVMISFFGLAIFLASGRLHLEEQPAKESDTPAAVGSESREKKLYSFPAFLGLWLIIALLTVTGLYTVVLIASRNLSDNWKWLFTMLMIDYYVILGLAGASLPKPVVMRVLTLSVCVAGLIWSVIVIWAFRSWYSSETPFRLFFTFMILAFWAGHAALLLRVAVPSLAVRIVQILTIGISGLTGLTLLAAVWGTGFRDDSLVTLISTQSVLILLGSMLTPLVTRATANRT